jgi:GDSL-like Lipase/Acylhydrolase family
MRPIHLWLALGVAVSAIVPAAGPALAASDPEVYVALGDSVSVGVGATPGRGFVERYFAHLQDPANGGVDALHNLARSGETSTSMRASGGQLEAAAARIAEPSDTTVVTLGIGGNDAGQCPVGFNTPPCPFSANYTAILGALQSALAGDPGDERLQVLEYHNPASGTGSPNEGLFDFGLLGIDAKGDCSATAAALGLNDLVRCIGSQYGAGSVDVYPTFKAGGQALMADALHPNDTGHAYIACLFEYPERAGSANPCEASPPPPPPPPPPPDRLAPTAKLSGPARQRVLRQRAISLFALLDEGATTSATARIAIPAARARSSARVKVVRLGPVTKSVAAGTRTRLTLRLSKRGIRSIRAALLTRRALKAKVTVKSTDAAGNSSLAYRTIKLVR